MKNLLSLIISVSIGIGMHYIPISKKTSLAIIMKLLNGRVL